MYRIEKYLATDQVDKEVDFIEVSESRLELVAVEGEVIDGEIKIRSQKGGEFHVFFYSSHYRMQCRISDLIAKEGVFPYRFDTTGLSAGSLEKGEICFVSESGEYHIPFTVSIKQPLKETTLGEIRNLFHFANLARERWEEAVSLFYSDWFRVLFHGHDRQYYNLYRALSGQMVNEHNVDEFLVGIHKKKKNTYEFLEEGLLLKEVTNGQREKVTVRCNGWGYSHVQICVKGEFLSVSKVVLETQDFVDGICPVSFEINTDYLRAGSNIGSITLIYETGSCELPVLVQLPSLVSRKSQERHNENVLVAQLMHGYIDYITEVDDNRKTLELLETILEKMTSLPGRNLRARLCQAHMLIAAERLGEAKWVLSHVEKTIKREEMNEIQYGYYLYLRTFLEEDVHFIRSVKEYLGALRVEKQGETMPACLYLRLVRDEIDAVSRMAIYEEEFLAGSRSPILYAEVYRVYKESLAYLSKLDEFEVQVLSFLLRYGLYTEDIADRVADLVLRKKDMSPTLFRFLSTCYVLYEDEKMLHALCTLMIRNSMCGPECFGIYESAVKKQMRITSLYEYYMMSADTRVDQLPPRSVLMYFAYHCELPERRKAYYFALLVKHRDEIPELFRQYEPEIRTFAGIEMEKGMISENLAVLYRYLLSCDSHKEIVSENLQRIVFRHLVEVKRPGITSVVVVQDKLEKESVYPLEKQRAYVDCFTPDYVILLQDSEGNRYIGEDEKKITKLMSIEKTTMYLEESEDAGLGFLIYRTNLEGEVDYSNKQIWPLYRKLAFCKEVDLSYRRSIMDKLLRLYFDREQYDQMTEILAVYDVGAATSEQRAEIVRYFVYMEENERALRILFDYGFENVSAKVLTRLVVRLLGNVQGFDDRVMALIYYTFSREKYTQEMLQYLCRYFEGTLKQMRDIWKICVQFEVEAGALAERILQAYLYSHGYLPEMEEVFFYYYNAMQKRDRVINAYINDMTYRYFVKQQLPQSKVFEALEHWMESDYETNELSRIAYLYYMATEVKSYSERQKKIIKGLVDTLLSQKQYVPFLLSFVDFIPAFKPYAELTYLEYRTTPGSSVILNYVLEGGSDQYCKKQLKEICPGYYCQSFTMFFGERLQYYFMEQKNGEQMLTESGFLERNDVTGTETESRFGILNDIVMCEALGDVRTGRELRTSYIRQSLLVERLFGEMAERHGE